jgi:FdhD protein
VNGQIRSVSATRIVQGESRHSTETLTQEAALQIRINGQSYTVTMRTPGNDRILVAGLLFTEGIVSRPDDLIDMREIANASGDTTLIVEVQLPEAALTNKRIFNRSITSSASCGVCGKIDLCDLVIPASQISTSRKISILAIPEMFDSMRRHQSTFDATGGSHAAALLTVDDEVLCVQEDIGRHNAVDKVIGDLFMTDMLQHAEVLLVSGRVSYEIVAKCARARIPFLLAVSAPSSLAVDFCNSVGITLIGFCRDQRATVYTHSERVFLHS